MFRFHSPLASLGLMALAALATGTPLHAQSEAELAAIEQAALDYIQGYYGGDAARMEKAVHPEIAKRRIRMNQETGEPYLENMDSQTLIEMVARRAGQPMPEEMWVNDVTILDLFENMASVRIDAGVWIDYLHLARWKGEWKIVNVLWEMRPRG